MKFAEHLSAHITPEWRKQYITYEARITFGKARNDKREHIQCPSQWPPLVLGCTPRHRGCFQCSSCVKIGTHYDHRSVTEILKVKVTDWLPNATGLKKQPLAYQK